MSENTFIFLGKTGVGKSLSTKLLTGNNSVKVSNKKKSETTEVTGYHGTIPSSFFSSSLNYQIIDTPGLNDSNGNDKINIQKLKEYLTNKSIKIKGIFIFLDFQDVRFDNAEQNIIKEIYKLAPLDNFWEYITLVFTHYYGDQFTTAEERRIETEDSLKEIFEKLIIESYYKECIKPINFKSMRIEYIDVYDPSMIKNLEKAKKAENQNKKFLDKYHQIFKQLSKKQPLYSKITKEKRKQKIIEYIGNNQGILYDAEIEVFKYHDQNDKIVKEKGIILDKTKDRIIEKKDFAFTKKTWWIGTGAWIATVGCIIGSFVFPPASPAFISAADAFLTTELGAYAIGGIKFAVDYSENNTYLKTKNITEYEKQ